MAWYVYLLISIFLISLNGLFHRSLLKDDGSSPQAQTIVFLGLGGVLATFMAIAQNKLNFQLPVALMWNFLLLILLLTPAYILKYRSYQLIVASEVVMFSATGKLWNVVGGYLFLNEVLTVKIILGALLILGGVMLTRYENKKFIVNRGVGIVLVAAFLFGMGDINNFHILKTVDSTNFLVYSYFLPVIAIVVLQPKSLRKISYYFHLHRGVKVLLLSIGDTVGMWMLFQAYQAGGQATIIGPLRATSIILTTLLAIVILKERSNIFNKITGSIIAVAGVMLLL